MRARSLLSANLVPLLFLVISVVAVWVGELTVTGVSIDILERVFRNSFLVLSLIIPIVAGLGLNFGIVLGAMSGQIGLLIVENGEVPGLAGICVAVICSIPIATFLGYLTGLLFNRTPGREMITGFILGFFAAGFYQFLFLILTGPVIPLHHPDLLLPPPEGVDLPEGEDPPGMGLRVTVNLVSVERGLDDAWGTIPLYFPRDPLRGDWTIGYGGEIPILTLTVIVLLCLAIWLFMRTKLGQDLRAVGQDTHVAEVAGLPVKRCRIIATILSMVLAGIGQIIFLQNMTVMNTFTSHEQVGFYAIAALLVGGATVSRARIWNALVGVVLFHTMITVVATAAQNRMGSPQIGEFLREFIAYGIIGTTLALHAWRSRKPG